MERAAKCANETSPTRAQHGRGFQHMSPAPGSRHAYLGSLVEGKTIEVRLGREFASVPVLWPETESKLADPNGAFKSGPCE